MIKFAPVNLIPQISFTSKRNQPFPVKKQPLPVDVFEYTQVDTVGGGVKNSQVIKNLGDYSGKMKSAIKLHEGASAPYRRFQIILEDVFTQNIKGEKGSNNAIEPIKTQIKSIESIHEKMASKRLTSVKQGLEEMDDIVRGRIIYTDGKKKNGALVADSIIDAIKHNKMNIVEIIHYRPNNLKERDLLEYITSDKMREIEAALDEQGRKIVSNHKEKPSGYLADHIIIKIPNTDYKAEIQIMGKHVEELKDVEDVCYKIKCGKKVPKALEKVRQAFELLEKNQSLMDEYNKYTTEAYKLQRLRDAGSKTVEKITDKFLRMDSKNLPKVLDFNNIDRLLKKL